MHYLIGVRIRRQRPTVPTAAERVRGRHQPEACRCLMWTLADPVRPQPRRLSDANCTLAPLLTSHGGEMGPSARSPAARRRFALLGVRCDPCCLSPDVKDRTATGAGANITDIGPAQLIGAQPREQTGQDQRQVSFAPVGTALGLPVTVNCLEQRGDRPLGEGSRGAWQPSGARRTTSDWPGSALRYRGSRTTHSTSNSGAGSTPHSLTPQALWIRW
jgi:hypothetical protein